MSFRIATTPLARTVPVPAPRGGGFDVRLFDAIVPAAGTAEIMERLRAPNVLAVTTGQQPALFTGPMYTVHKALSARALAAELERRWSRPVVPLFWVAGDDHDFAEANHAAWLGRDGDVVRAALRTRPADAAMLPLYREPLGPEVDAAVASLGASLPESEFRAPTLTWIGRHYRPAASISSSFAAALAELLAPFGILCIDSTHPAVKRAASPWLSRALGVATALDASLAARAASLHRGGADPGVAVGDGATLVMIEAALGRDRLVADGEGFVTRRSRERFTRSEIERIAAAEPERLSANVLLRPAIESAILPTVAYAAGPGELRYLQLTGPIYDALDVVPQTPVARWSGMVVDARVDRVLEKFGIDVGALETDLAALEAQVVRKRIPAEADADLNALRALLAQRYDALADLAGRIDPTLTRSVSGRRDRAIEGVERIERKLVSHLKRRMQVEIRQLRIARNAVRPDGQPQERVLCAPSFLARHGPGVLSAAAEAAQTWYGTALEAGPVSA